MRKLTICILSITSLLRGEDTISSLEVDLEWFDSPIFHTPYRLNDLEGAMIALLAENPSPVPLLFPSLVSPFEWIDSGDPEFLSLDELCQNPSLRPPIKQYEHTYRSPFAESKDIWNDSIDQDSPIVNKEEKFSIQRLIGGNADNLPDDQQLLTFLRQGKVQLSSEEKQKILEALFSEDEQKDFIARLLKPNPTTITFESIPPAPEAAIPSAPEPVIPEIVELTVPKIEIPEAPDFSARTELPDLEKGMAMIRLKVFKNSQAGVKLPAQASEFYLTSQNFLQVFQNLNEGEGFGDNLNGLAEFWANAEKNSDRDKILQIQSSLVRAKVGKARTNAFGQAVFSTTQSAGKYNFIGIEKDDLKNEITIWSKQAKIESGENMVELTANDVIYQE